MKRLSADRQPIIDGDQARVPLTQGLYALIDSVDAELVGGRHWFVNRNARRSEAYAAANFGAHGLILMHRMVTGAAPELFVDHANHDTLDNRRANLRIATCSNNNRNLRGLKSTNTSGFIGVTRERRHDRWRARASGPCGRIVVGFFATAEEAAHARDEWLRTNYSTPFTTYNFPLPGEHGIHRLEGVTA